MNEIGLRHGLLLIKDECVPPCGPDARHVKGWGKTRLPGAGPAYAVQESPASWRRSAAALACEQPK